MAKHREGGASSCDLQLSPTLLTLSPGLRPLGEPRSDLPLPIKELEPTVLKSSNSSVSFLCHLGNSKSWLVNRDLRSGESYGGLSSSARLRGKDGCHRLCAMATNRRWHQTSEGQVEGWSDALARVSCLGNLPPKCGHGAPPNTVGAKVRTGGSK